MILPVPLTIVHNPVPVAALLPAKVALVLQTVCPVPALDAVGAANPVMVTVEVDEGQGALEMVHSKTFAPVPNPVIPLVGDPGVVIIPAPLTNVHVPTPTVGAFPASVVDDAQMV